MALTIHIERLILEGFPPDALDAGQVQMAIQLELARLLAEGGLGAEIAAGGAFATRLAPPIAGPAQQPQALGAQIAGAVYGGLGGGDRETG
jgi:hypothetical protein